MHPNILLLTPPFTQLNTPYPATPYIKGFLNTKGIASHQADLGIEVILELFSKKGLADLFAHIATLSIELSENARRIIALQNSYIRTIDPTIQFLQGINPTLALQICQDGFLPEASRFAQLEELDYAFGSMGTQDKAKHLATLFLEDISDLIVEAVDENFGFSRYAERLGRSANSFDTLYNALQLPFTYIDTITIRVLQSKITATKPDLVLMSVPFPGNLYSAFRCAQWLNAQYPETRIAMGGGFPNTELRSVSDTRVFEFFDFITLDDGEVPVEALIENIRNPSYNTFKRTFLLQDGIVVYRNESTQKDYPQSQVGTPDYSDLLLEKYISVIEIVNPMHRMWSDGRWNKLTMAHGCYWGKCTFCDISLDYIKLYEPVAANLLCDRIEALIVQTGQTGFHFVDEAAPPALMRSLALEIIRRRITITWWTNIRFEKSFSRDLCILLKESGCIAVSGGLEVASDRLLKLIDKGVTVEQVAKVTRNFTDSGIMVHAYLMYGYPTQTVQETIDSLEMVRQLFESGVLQSGFWHQFAMTAHSPVGIEPAKFGVVKESEQVGSFANNDVAYRDLTGIDHDQFSFGLKKSLFNFMHGICFDHPLQDWFDFKIPRTTVHRNFIANALEETTDLSIKLSAKTVWLGASPQMHRFTKSKKGNSWPMVALEFHDRRESFTLQLSEDEGVWFVNQLEKLSVENLKLRTLQEVKTDFESSGLENFELFFHSKPIQKLRDHGLLLL